VKKGTLAEWADYFNLIVIQSGTLFALHLGYVAAEDIRRVYQYPARAQDGVRI
jgi:hypothetical protein